MKKICLLTLLMLVSLLIVSPVSADSGIDDRVIFGGSVVVDVEDVVDDLVVLGGSADVRGTVRGDMVVFGGSAAISGEVRGDIVVFGGSVDLKSTAFVGKDVAVFGGSLKKATGAKIGGSTIRGTGGSGLELPGFHPYSFRFNDNPLWGFISGLFKGMLATLALIGLGILVVALFPRQLEVTEDVLEEALAQSAGVGLLTWLAAVFFSIILVISLIGILFAPLLWLVLGVVALFAFVATANLIGERVMRGAFARATRPMESTLIGILLLMVVTVPLNAVSGGCLGTLLLFVAVTPALGATVLSRFGTMHWTPGFSGGPPTGRIFPPPPPPQPPVGTVENEP